MNEFDNQNFNNEEQNSSVENAKQDDNVNSASSNYFDEEYTTNSQQNTPEGNEFYQQQYQNYQVPPNNQGYYQQVPPQQPYQSYNNYQYQPYQQPYNQQYQSFSQTYPQYNAPQEPKKKGLHPGIITIIIILIIAVFAVLIAFLASISDSGSLDFNGTRIEIDIPIQERPKLDDEYYQSDGRYTAEGVAKAVKDSVVGVIVYGADQQITPISQGSGIILSEDGYIITNAHVIESADTLKVILDNDDEYTAQVVGKDTKTDLAVIKISAKNLTPASFGDSDKVALGEQVIAIGSPGGLSGSITSGIVSGLNRPIKSDQNGFEMNCIQTDAAINPGNSGGALVNMWGQVIGINSSKYVATDFEGIGFAISFNEAKPIIEDLISVGYVQDRVKIGISFYEITEETAKQNDLVPGLYIVSISPDTEIAKTELKKFDIITEMNGMPVTNFDDVNKAIEGQKPGDTVKAKVYRKSVVGEEKTFEIEFKLMADIG